MRNSLPIAALALSRRSLGPAVALALSALIAVGCGDDSVPKDSVCSVGGESIKKMDYQRIVDQAERNLVAQGQRAPEKGTPEYGQLRNRAVDFLVEQQLIANEAERLGVQVDEKDVARRLDQFKGSFAKGDKDAYAKELKKQEMTERDVKDFLRQQLLSEKLFEKVVGVIRVDDERAKRHYDDNPGSYMEPRQRDIAHILVKTKRAADEVYAKVKGGDEAVFTAVARKQSQDPASAQNGGRFTVSKGQTAPELDALAFSMKEGQISKPVKSQLGYHIVSVRGKIKPGRQQKFDEVKTGIKQTLELETRNRRLQDWRTKLRKEAKDTVTCKGFLWSAVAESAPPPGAPPPTSTTEVK